MSIYNKISDIQSYLINFHGPGAALQPIIRQFDLLGSMLQDANLESNDDVMNELINGRDALEEQVANDEVDESAIIDAINYLENAAHELRQIDYED